MYQLIRNMRDGHIFIDGYTDEESSRAFSDYYGLLDSEEWNPYVDTVKSIYLIRVYPDARMSYVDGHIFGE